MNANYIVGGIFFIIITIGAYKSIKSFANNSCPGCSGGCSKERCKSCRS